MMELTVCYEFDSEPYVEGFGELRRSSF